MEPFCQGPRFRWKCPRCFADFETSFNVHSLLPLCEAPETLEHLKNLRYMGCPECGFAEVPFEGNHLIDGDVMLLRSTLFCNGYQRGQVVLFRDDAGRPSLKRIVGLPKEKLKIHRGDLFVNDIPLIKTEQEFSQQASFLPSVRPQRKEGRIVLVHQTPLPWLSEDEKDRQNQLTATPLTNRPLTPSLEVLDSDSIENVSDFRLDFSYTLTQGNEKAPVRFAVNRGNSFYLIEIAPQQGTFSVFVAINGQDVQAYFLTGLQDEQTNDPPHFEGRLQAKAMEKFVASQTIPFSLQCWDGLVRLKIQEQTILTLFAGPERDQPIEPLIVPCIFFENGNEFSDFRFFRDIHYSVTGDEPFIVEIPENAYFLLGDNSPSSSDCRQSNPPYILKKQIEGTVTLSQGSFF